MSEIEHIRRSMLRRELERQRAGAARVAPPRTQQNMRDHACIVSRQGDTRDSTGAQRLRERALRLHAPAMLDGGPPGAFRRLSP